MMEHVTKMAADVAETVVVADQFSMGMVSLLSQTGNKCILHNVRCTTFHKQGRCRVFQMKKIWMSSICHM